MEALDADGITAAPGSVRFARPFLFVFGSSDPPRFRFRAPGARRNARAGAADASLDSLVASIANQKTAQRPRVIAEDALMQRLSTMSATELDASNTNADFSLHPPHTSV